jgi:hypothetical protein
MGTRADFYVGRGENAKWIGSIAWDGYVEGIPSDILLSFSKKEFQQRVTDFLEKRDDKTTPDMGWPWPWENSNTTDFSYAFDLKEKKVYVSHFGKGWRSAEQALKNFEENRVEEDYWETDNSCVFPNMRHVQNVSLGKNSGIMVFRPSEE